MKFKDIFDKEIIVEDHIRKGLKIIYEIDLNLIKPTAEEPPQQEVPQQVQQNPQQDAQQIAQPQTTEPIQQPEPAQQEIQQQPEQQSGVDVDSFVNAINASVVTEEDDNEAIIKKYSGEIKLNESQKDNIQSFDDILDVISKLNKNGEKSFDDFCIEVISLCANQNYNELKNKLDKKSKIFIEIYYGYNKQDSVGIRFSKRPMSDILTSTMLVDNEIISSKFDINRINQQIVEYRNYEANKNK